MAPHSSRLAWKIPWTEEPRGLPSMASLGVGHDRATSLSLFTFMLWRRKWQPTPVFLPGESQGQRSLVGCCLWSRTESDTTEATQQQQQPPTTSSQRVAFLPTQHCHLLEELSHCSFWAFDTQQTLILQYSIRIFVILQTRLRFIFCFVKFFSGRSKCNRIKIQIAQKLCTREKEPG